MIFTAVNPPAAAVNHVLGLGNTLWSTMLTSYVDCYKTVWNNPNATPSQIIAAMGNQGVKIFQHSAAVAAILASEGAKIPGTTTAIPTTTPVGYTCVYNADGTVSVTAVPTPST